MQIYSTRLLIAAVAVAAVLAGYRSRAVQPGPSPFDPEVEEFVDIYLKGGGDKLTNWVQGDRTSTPDEALRAFKPLDGLAMELVASEPVIRQPIDMHFDERGRLWVVQYLQYPFPAGLKVVRYDQYLRAVFDKVPEPPPHGTPGADKITVFEDTNGDGLYDRQKDVITGLNIATAVVTGKRCGLALGASRSHA